MAVFDYNGFFGFVSMTTFRLNLIEAGKLGGSGVPGSNFIFIFYEKTQPEVLAFSTVLILCIR